MTPKEKAKYLVDKFEQFDFVDGRIYAEIAVDEIIESWNTDGNARLDIGIINYWNKVKEEIIKP